MADTPLSAPDSAWNTLHENYLDLIRALDGARPQERGGLEHAIADVQDDLLDTPAPSFTAVIQKLAMGAMALGIDRRTAADFSFFLALPTLTGATVLQLYKHRDAITADSLGLIAVGFVVSFVVALAVVKAFLAIVTKHGFAPFAWYRIVAGAAALVWLGMR